MDSVPGFHFPSFGESTAAGDVVLRRFKALYRQAWMEHRQAFFRASSQSPAHQAAVQWAHQHAIPGAAALLNVLPALWNEKEPESALALLAGALPLLPPGLSGEALHTQGVLFLLLHRNSQAMPCFERALVSPEYETPWRPYLGMSALAVENGEHEAALDYARRALNCPGLDTPVEALINMAEALSALDRREESLECYRKALDHPEDKLSDSLRGYYRIGLAYTLLYSGRQEEAFESFETALRELGADAPPEIAGGIYLTMGQYHPDGDRAIGCFQKTIDLCHSVSTSNARLYLGTALLYRQQPARSVEALENALSLPASPVTRRHIFYWLGSAWLALNYPDEAIRCFEENLAALPAGSPTGDVYDQLADAWSRKGDKAAAAHCYRKSFGLQDSDQPGHDALNLGLACVLAGDFDTAAEQFEKALAAPGFDRAGEALHGLGTSSENQGDYDAALNYYQRALDTLGYTDPVVTHHAMAELLNVIGEYPRALEACRQALAYPDYPRTADVQECMEIIEAKQGRRFTPV